MCSRKLNPAFYQQSQDLTPFLLSFEEKDRELLSPARDRKKSPSQHFDVTGDFFLLFLSFKERKRPGHDDRMCPGYEKIIGK